MNFDDSEIQQRISHFTSRCAVICRDGTIIYRGKKLKFKNANRRLEKACDVDLTGVMSFSRLLGLVTVMEALSR